jgi:IBR domain, a half RING-finger domain
LDAAHFIYNTEGSAVKFGSGVRVLSLRLASDSSAIHMENLPGDATIERLLEFLRPSQFQLSTENIAIKALPDGTAIADIQLDDPHFADKIVKLYDSALFAHHLLRVRPAQVREIKGASSNSRHAATLICSWHKPSRVAWAHYEWPSDAQRAQRVMNGQRIDGREVQCSFKMPPLRSRRKIVYSVQIGNLAGITTSSYLQHRFSSAADVAMGHLSYDSSPQEVANLVRSLLQKAGSLESFELNSSANPRFEKAFAKFSSHQEARSALQKFHGHTLPELNTKLFLNLSLSVKFTIRRDLFKVVEMELNNLRIQILAGDHIMLKTYESEDRPTLLTLRVYGEDAKLVAKAKNSIEIILAGTPAKMEDRFLWHDFLLNHEGLAYLKSIQELHGGFIYRDSRRRRLSLYGASNVKRCLQDALIEKINLASDQSRKILLTPTTLRKVFEGGLEEILRILGDGKAGLHLTPGEKALKINGSEQDVRTAKAILEDSSTTFTKSKEPSADAEAECSVCWTPPDDAYRTSCGHSYCKDCFSGLCASAIGPEHFPLKCLGDATQCTHVFEIVELQKALTATAFDSLLKASMETHIQTRPAEFQYCVTADCPQVYRITRNGHIFDCPSCLTPICTSCQSVSHTGSTCDEYRDLTSGGTLALKKWMADNKGKPCPKCQAPIQKAYGCNHMQCSVCSTHFCWFCMAICDAAEIYIHMTDKHGNIGTEAADTVEDQNVEMLRLFQM